MNLRNINIGAAILLAAIPACAQVQAPRAIVIASASQSGVPQPAQPAITPPKKPGTLRVGITTPQAQMGQGNSATPNVAEPIRALVVQYLSGPALDVIPLAAMIPAQIEAEANQKECDYVLYSSITQKKVGGTGLLSKAMPMAGMIPMVGALGGAAGAISAAGAATAASAAAAQAAQSAAGIAAGSVKAKSEVTFEYKLLSPGNTAPVLANSLKAKAKSDGEDVITPLIQQAATSILSAATVKK
jgi:hypothetical protein